MEQKKKNFNIRLRKNRSRVHVLGTVGRPRISVFRSNKYIYGQLIDDITGHTLASVSSRALASEKSKKIEAAKEVGKRLAALAIKLGIKIAVFHRGQYHYHGRVAAVADGCREAGLKI